jgi:large subunit ribosomal protein L23
MVVLYPVTTEKAINLLQLQNKLTFIVEPKATKTEIKKEIEQKFDVKVEKVNVMNTLSGKRKALVKLTKEFKADDVAAKLKIA